MKKEMHSQVLKEDLELLSAKIGCLGFAGNSVLVTGATGLLGSLIIKAIHVYNQTHAIKVRVVAFARSSEKVDKVFGDGFKENCKDTIRFVFQDICSPISNEIECEYVIHTANPTSSKFFMSNPVQVIESIYMGLHHVLEYCRQNRVKGCVYLSSMEVFGVVDTSERLSEEHLGKIDISNIRSCYSEGKRLAECLCKSYAVQYGVPVRIARLAQTFGAGVLENESRVFMQFAKSAMRGDDIVLHTTGESIGNYCYTRDAIEAILLLLVKGENGEAYTVVNEETTMSIVSMARLVAKKFSDGKSKVRFDIPENNVYGYAPQTGMRLSAKKLMDLGWKPKENLEQMYSRMMRDISSKAYF